MKGPRIDMFFTSSMSSIAVRVEIVGWSACSYIQAHGYLSIPAELRPLVRLAMARWENLIARYPFADIFVDVRWRRRECVYNTF